MIKKLSQKILAAFLATCTLMSIFALSIPVVSAAEVKSNSSVSYISALKVATNDEERYAKSGFEFIDKNINSNSYVYLGYKRTFNPEEAITGIVFSNQKSDTITYGGRTYQLLSSVNFSPYNYNLMYLYFTYEPDPYGTTEYLTNLDVIQTDSSFSLKGNNYKPVLYEPTNMPADIDGSNIEDFPFISSKRTYLIYESQPSPEAVYQKTGNDKLRQIVKSVNGTNYYNFDADISKSDFLERAMTMQYNGNSAIESWSQVLYAMLGVHDKSNGYYTCDSKYSFDDLFGNGMYIDLVAALTNGTGVSNSFSPLSSLDSPTLVRSSGVKTAKDISSVYKEMCTLHYNGNPNNYDINLDFLKNEKSSSDVVYSLCNVSRGDGGSQTETFSDTIGILFYNFELIPVVENGDKEGTDLLNYADSYTNKEKNESSVKIDKNDSAATVSSSKSFSNSKASSTTNSHSATNGNTYTVTKGVSFGASSNFGNKIPLTVNGNINLNMSEAFNFSESDTITDSITQTTTNNDGLTYSIPAYSIAALNCVSSNEERTQAYDCSVALSYDVAFFSYGSKGFSYPALLGNTYAYKGKQNTSWCVKIGGEDNSALDTLKSLFNSQGKDQKGFSVECKIFRYDTLDHSFTNFSSEEWSKIFNTNIKSYEFPSSMHDTVKFLSNYQPMSFLGGVFNSDVSAVTYTLDKFYALYPIDKIRVLKTNPASSAQSLVQHIDIKKEGSYRLQDYYNTISAFDEHNSSWTNWDPTKGYWALITDDPSTGEEKIIKITTSPVSDGIVSAYKDSKTGLIYINPIKDGKSYIRYVINENEFQYYPNIPGDATEFSTLNLKYVTNDDISAKGTIEINTSNIKHNYDENGFCTNCGAYQPAYLNSDKVYEISNAGQLYWFSALVNGDHTHAEFEYQNGSANAVLIKDIVVNNADINKLADTQSETLRKWSPIGTYDNSYTGKFDGQRHTVSGLYFSDSNAENIGLFGYTRGGANISNVGLINSYLKGKNCVGGILGRNNNSGVNVQRCFSEATVIGNEGVGGIVGSTYGGKIIDCYNAGSVTGVKYVGSIRGRNTYNTKNSGAMNNCFNVGEVVGTGNSNIGGIRGDGNGTISNCYCISTKLTDTAATTKSPEQFANGEVAYLLNNSVTDGKQIWYQNIDNGETPNDYPRFDGGTVYYIDYKDSYSNTYSKQPKEPDEFDKDDDGNLIITTYDDLVKLSKLIRSDYEVYGSQNYILENNIKASDDSEWVQGIGSVSDSKPFNGTFDGNGYCIIGLNVNSAEYGGLFEIIGENGCVKDLFVFDCDFKSSSNVSGGIVAINNGIIDHCASGINLTTGTIHFRDKFIDAAALNSSIKGKISGGISGENNGLITGSRNTAVVTGTQCGGITAENYGKIYGCANSVKIGTSASNVSGGLVGRNGGIIENAYNSGMVNGSSEKALGSIAGINGYNGAENPKVKNVFYSTVNNLNAVGTDSLTKPDKTNKAKSKNSDFQSDTFVDELNFVSDDTVVWIRNPKFNKGNPTIKGNFFKYSVKSAGNNITVEGSMHEALNIKYDVCTKKDDEYTAITSALGKRNILNVYSVSVTDNDGDFIPAELWCQSGLKISVPVNSKNVEFAGLNTDGQITYYKPDSVKNGVAVFTVPHPMSFVIVDSTNKNISDNKNTDDVINRANYNTPIQTGSTSYCVELLVMLFALALLIVFMRRNSFE